jgi:hypothetical protein
MKAAWMRRSCLLLVGIGLLSLQGQHLENPSFEGPRGPSLLPAPWEACGQGSTPDTQPGVWNVHTVPATGQSYLSLICRGDGVPFPNKWERCQQELARPLEQGICYLYSVDLARSASFSAGGHGFSRQASFRIWGGKNSCEANELLWESGPVTHTDWRTYEVILWPQEGTYSFLLVEAYYALPTHYSGNLLVDDFMYYPDEYPCLPNS